MADPLSMAELRKLVAIMELATGSSFDGERLAALERARSLLAGHELRWRDVLHTEPEAPTAIPSSASRGWKAVAQELLQIHQATISDWEQGFLLSLVLKMPRLSPKQAAVLKDLCSKYGVQPWAVAP
jgi:hypothetical protein